jgi:hypothetical protein
MEKPLSLPVWRRQGLFCLQKVISWFIGCIAFSTGTNIIIGEVFAGVPPGKKAAPQQREVFYG